MFQGATYIGVRQLSHTYHPTNDDDDFSFSRLDRRDLLHRVYMGELNETIWVFCYCCLSSLSHPDAVSIFNRATHPSMRPAWVVCVYRRKQIKKQNKNERELYHTHHASFFLLCLLFVFRM
jgi:hypothetical protein